MNAKVIIIILSAVIILGAGGYAAWNFFISPTSEAKEAKQASAAELAENSVETDEITTDLEDGSIVQIQFQLITDGEKAKEEVTARQFQLKNIVIKEMTTMNKDDFQAGLSDLEESLKKKLNEDMQEGKIEDVYTISKVLQ
ncbi:flagellar basal body-associated FliL family protein [Terribacillus saccharophilus]|uniref:flagellar basal body-associated FliL family protein n=1 Tax=Terribacillus saccharophilus TaxID=361277 RepID=UPI0039821320